jgi:TetR/AcrR family transcriptional repressor of nem operon
LKSKSATTDSGLVKIGARERVLEAARRLIEAQGFTNASLNEILAAAGVSSSNFYYHWKSKEDLGLSVVRQFTEYLEQHVIQAIVLDRSRRPVERLRAFLDFHRSKLEGSGCTGGCPFGKLTAELSDSNPCFREELERVFARLREALKECIRDAVAAGEVRRSVDAQHASVLVLAAVQGLMLVAKSERTTALFAQGADELLRLLIEPASSK